MSNKRYDVLTDIGAKLFVADSVPGIQNFLKFFDDNYETKKVSHGCRGTTWSRYGY